MCCSVAKSGIFTKEWNENKLLRYLFRVIAVCSCDRNIMVLTILSGTPMKPSMALHLAWNYKRPRL